MDSAAKDTPRTQPQGITMLTNPIREAFDSEYHKTIEGKMQIITIIYSFSAYLISLFMTCPHCSSINFINVISGFNTWITICYFLFGSFHIYERIQFVPWKLSLFGWSSISTIFYTIGFILLIMDLKYLPIAVISLIGVLLHAFMAKYYYSEARITLDEMVAKNSNNTSSQPNNQV